jgi:hypothetical protein
VVGDDELASPRYFCTNSDPTTRMKEAFVALATALTSIVFPVPGDQLKSPVTNKGMRLRTWRTVKQNTSRGVDTNLPI